VKCSGVGKDLYSFTYKLFTMVLRNRIKRDDEVFYLLRYNVVKSVESQPTFRRNMSHPPSGSSSVCHLFQGGFSLGLFFDPEGGGDMFLRNVG
jgi:hypothetical protein